ALLTPSCGGPSADREEKRVTHGTVQKKVQEHLDQNDPNQRGLSADPSLTSTLQDSFSKTAHRLETLVRLSRIYIKQILSKDVLKSQAGLPSRQHFFTRTLFRFSQNAKQF
ncbi:hypothetical protein D3227_40550, partial [Mesorhizobium waimense]